MHSALLTGCLDGQNFLTPRNPVRTLCTAVIHNLCPSGVLAVHGIIRLHTSTQPRTGASSSQQVVYRHTLRWTENWLMLKYWQNKVNMFDSFIF